MSSIKITWKNIKTGEEGIFDTGKEDEHDALEFWHYMFNDQITSIKVLNVKGGHDET